VPQLPLVYSRILRARGLCPSSRKAASTSTLKILLPEFLMQHLPILCRATTPSDAFCQFV